MKSSQVFRLFCSFLLLLFAVSCASSTHLSRTPPMETPSQKLSKIQKIAFVEEGNYSRIRIEGSEPLTPPVSQLSSNPLRIVIDIPNIDLDQVKSPVEVNNGTIGSVTTTQYDDKGRVEVSLNQMTNYSISREGNDLIIDIERPKKVAEIKEPGKEEEVKREKGGGTTPAEPSALDVRKEETLPPQPVVTSPASAPSPQMEKKAKEVVDLLLELRKDFVAFNIIADGKLGNYDSIALDSPPRFVLDIWEVSTRYSHKSIKVESPFIKEVRVGLHPEKVRLVFYPTKSQLPPYEINRINDRLIVSFGNVPPSAGSQILGGDKAAGSTPTPAKQGSGGPAKAAEESLKATKRSSMTEIEFMQMDDKSRIIAAFTEEPRFESNVISKKAIEVDIKNAVAPKHLQRPLDTSSFDSAVSSVSVKNVQVGKSRDVRLSIQLREEMPFELTKEGKTLLIDVERPKRVEVKKEVAPPPETKSAEIKKGEEKAVAEPKKIESLPEEKLRPGPEATKKAQTEKEEPVEKPFAGRKLSLDFKDADIKNILRLIAEVSNLNIIAGDDVTGRVTMRLVDVPWDQALDVILQARSLGMTRVGNVIRVAPLDTLKKELQSDLEAKRTKERLEDLQTELVPINYATAKDILPQAKSVLSDRGDVKVDERTNTLIVKDIPKNITGVKGLVKALDTKTPQVMIEARIVEANLSFQRDLGVKWGFLLKGSGMTVGGGHTDTVLGTTVSNVVGLPAQPTATGTEGILELLFTSAHGIRQLDLVISAAESNGDVSVISSPKIATLDNREASIEQGLRIPYPKLTTEGTVSTDFIEANLKLTVTPHVTNDGHIKMNIKARKDAPVYNAALEVLGVPPIDKKEAITEVMVKDNSVVVIGGIYTIEKDQSSLGIPLFSKIPVLGWLFKSETKKDDRKDLLIFISPKIIKDPI